MAGGFPLLNTLNDFTPINDMVVVVPSDTVDLQYNGQSVPARALLIQGAGTLVFDTPQGNTVTLTVTSNWFGVQYIRAKRVRATGTTIGAGLIHACY